MYRQTGCSEGVVEGGEEGGWRDATRRCERGGRGGGSMVDETRGLSFRSACLSAIAMTDSHIVILPAFARYPRPISAPRDAQLSILLFQRVELPKRQHR